jgi:hypothetical protein
MRIYLLVSIEARHTIKHIRRLRRVLYYCNFVLGLCIDGTRPINVIISITLLYINQMKRTFSFSLATIEMAKPIASARPTRPIL